MSSLYPNAIDGQAQIPITRDRITEITASKLNSLREAIINVQTELGLVPKDEYASVAARLAAMQVQLAVLEASLTVVENDLESIEASGYVFETKSFPELASHTIRERWRSYGDTILVKFNIKAVSGVSTSSAGTYLLNLKKEAGSTETALESFNLETLVDRTDTEVTLSSTYTFVDGEYLIVEIASNNSDLTGGSGIAATPTFRTV